MRLVVICIVLFLAPAGCLLVTDRFVSNIEDGFQQDAAWQIKRFNRIIEMYPPRAATLRNAGAIQQLKRFGDGHQIASAVCGPVDTPYRRLFERLTIRCSEWSVLRRSRYAALIGVLLTVLTLALILIARIAVRRYQDRKQWAGIWTTWFAVRGIYALLAVQVAAALAGFGILLQVLLGKPLYTYAALAAPWLGLFWTERRLVAGFVESHKLQAPGLNRRERHARVARIRAERLKM